MELESFAFRRGPYEVFILFLTVLSLINGCAILLAPNADWVNIVRYMDFAITIILMADFATLFRHAPNKRLYMTRGWGWADFLGSLPFPGFRLFRLIRFYAVSRRMRIEGKERFKSRIKGQLSESTLLFVTFGLILLLEFGSILVLSAENNVPNSNIKTGGEAIWWASVTITTVGYGDYYPVTAMGRVVGVLIMAFGLSLLAVFTGYVTNTYFKRKDAEVEPKLGANAPVGNEDSQMAILAELERLNTVISELRNSIESSASYGKPTIDPTIPGQ